MSSERMYQKLSVTPYELSELESMVEQRNLRLEKKPIDYGTGELYTSVEVHTVSRIHLNPGITAKEIADKTLRTQSAVSQVISKLEKKGLLRMETDEEDARKTCLYVTEKGLELSKKHIEYDNEMFGQLLDDAIALFGIDSVEKYIQIQKFMANKDWEILK